MNQPRFQRPKNALDERNLKLTGDLLPGSTRPPTMSVVALSNQLRFSCYTNKEHDKNNGQINAKMSSIAAYAFLETLKEAIADPTPDKRYGMENDGVVNGDWRNPSHETTLFAGRDAKGVIYIGVTHVDESRPRLKFPLLPTNFHRFVNRDGSPCGDVKSSEFWARGWCKLLEVLAGCVLATNYVEPKPKDAPQGGQGGGNRGGGGGGYRPNNGGGGGQRNYTTPAPAASSDFDDDIPF